MKSADEKLSSDFLRLLADFSNETNKIPLTSNSWYLVFEMHVLWTLFFFLISWKVCMRLTVQYDLKTIRFSVSFKKWWIATRLLNASNWLAIWVVSQLCSQGMFCLSPVSSNSNSLKNSICSVRYDVVEFIGHPSWAGHICHTAWSIQLWCQDVVKHPTCVPDLKAAWLYTANLQHTSVLE